MLKVLPVLYNQKADVYFKCYDNFSQNYEKIYFKKRVLLVKAAIPSPWLPLPMRTQYHVADSPSA
jgi:hypothetical protein